MPRVAGEQDDLHCNHCCIFCVAHGTSMAPLRVGDPLVESAFVWLRAIGKSPTMLASSGVQTVLQNEAKCHHPDSAQAESVAFWKV